MSRTTVLLVEPSAAVRQHLVPVLAAIARTHLETCTSERIAAESLRLRPSAWLLADPVRTLAADGAAAILPRRCASLSLDASHDQLIAAIRAGAGTHFALPEQAQALAHWLRDLMRAEPTFQGGEAPLVAQSASMRRLLALIDRIAASRATVFLTGESGVGKEVLAREIHRRSPRRARPFEAVNCAAVPETMLEALLFGHERGAFTGATESRAGKFRAADGGTLLLDEITEMPLGLQAKLLRVLQEREVEPLGARTAKPVDVRVLATSNRPPSAALAEGLLRQDLFYRLNVFPVRLPPLRERPGDLIPLAEAFARECSAGRIGGITASAAQRLRAYAWPGNVRELHNIIERSCVLCADAHLDGPDLMFDQDWSHAVCPGAAMTGQEPVPMPVEKPSLDLDSQLQQRENRVILDTLQAVGGDRKQMASRLGISPRTLRYKLARLRDAGVQIPAV